MCEILINCESELHPSTHTHTHSGGLWHNHIVSIDVNTVVNSDKIIQPLPVFTPPITTVATVFWGWKASFLHPNMLLSRRQWRVASSVSLQGKSLCWHITNGEPGVSFRLVLVDYCSLPVWFFLLRQQLSILFRSERGYQNLQKSLRCRPRWYKWYYDCKRSRSPDGAQQLFKMWPRS